MGEALEQAQQEQRGAARAGTRNPSGGPHAAAACGPASKPSWRGSSYRFRSSFRPSGYPAEIEASAYFIVAEALTNVVKHAHAGRAEVTASVQNGTLHVAVYDDGIGGADPTGHGLVGISDRVTALGGRLKIDSPANSGTLVAAALPLIAG